MGQAASPPAFAEASAGRQLSFFKSFRIKRIGKAIKPNESAFNSSPLKGKAAKPPATPRKARIVEPQIGQAEAKNPMTELSPPVAPPSLKLRRAKPNFRQR